MSPLRGARIASPTFTICNTESVFVFTFPPIVRALRRPPERVLLSGGDDQGFHFRAHRIRMRMGTPRAFDELGDAPFAVPGDPFVGRLAADAEGIAEARDGHFSFEIRRNEFHALIHGTGRFPGHPPSL